MNNNTLSFEPPFSKVTTMHSLIPTTPTIPTTWLLPNLLPASELVLLDGPSGSGKTVFLAHIAATLSHQNNQPILALTSKNQRDLFIEHLANHNPNYQNLQGLDLPAHTSENTPLTEHLFEFLKTTITNQKPQLLLIDSLEELLAPLSPPGRGAGGEGDPSHGEALHVLWHSLRQLAHETNCTILITRTHGHHESRQYTPFTRYGSEATRYALTLLYHPHDSHMRVITQAKNQRGPIGEQFHLLFTPTGSTFLAQADFHQHVKPTRTPTTWLPSPRNLIEDQKIIDLTEQLMLGQPILADALIKELTKSYPLPAIRRALAITRMPITFDTHRWYYLPTQHMLERAPYVKAEMLNDRKIPENTARTHHFESTTDTQQLSLINKHPPPNHHRQAG